MILVTGANGFLGQNLIHRLGQDNRQAISLYRGAKVRIEDTCWEADLSRADHLGELMKQTPVPDTVIHLAGKISIGLAPNPLGQLLPPVARQDNIGELYLANTLTTANVLEYCLRTGVKHLIYASSQAVYGMPHGHLLEESPCQPLEHYALSKLAGEQILRLGSDQRLAVTTLRFPGLYGPTRRSGVVYNFCKSAWSKRHIVVNPTIPLPIDVLYIDDIVDCLLKTIAYGGGGWQYINVATGEPCNLDLLADAVAALVPDCEVTHSDIPQPVVRMNVERAKRLLGWEAVPLKTRLAFMLETIQGEC